MNTSLHMSCFFWLLLAHACGDFIFQSTYILRLRNSRSIRHIWAGNGMHAAIHLVLSLPVLGLVPRLSTMVIMLGLAVMHYMIDMMKSLYIKHFPAKKNSLSLFLGDQFIHFIVLGVGACLMAILSTGKWYMPPLQVFIRHLPLYLSEMEWNARLAASVSIIIFTLWGLGIFIRIFFERFRLSNTGMSALENAGKPEKRQLPDGGFLIGVLERLFIICSIVLNIPQVIGFVLATKSIARFKKFDDDRFVESFIIGSFMSFVGAIIAGVLIVQLKVFSPIG